MNIYIYIYIVRTPCLFIKGGMKWGGWEIFTRNEGNPGMGGLVYNGAMVNFKVSLHSWQRVPTLLFYEEHPPPPMLPTHTPFSNFVHTPPNPTSLSLPTAAPTVFSVFMFLWVNG